MYPRKKTNSYATTDKPNPFLQSPAKVQEEAENARQDKRRPRHPVQVQPYYPEPVSFFRRRHLCGQELATILVWDRIPSGASTSARLCSSAPRHACSCSSSTSSSSSITSSPPTVSKTRNPV